MSQGLVHFSALRRGPLLDRGGERLGRVEDVIVHLPEDGYPPLRGLKARIGGRDLFLPAALLASLTPDGTRLAAERLNLGRFERREGEVLLGSDVLGRFLVHVAADPPRLIRAEELLLHGGESGWRLVGVETGFAPHLRRLLPRPLRGDLKGGRAIDWRELDPFVGHVPTMRRRLRHRKLAKLHPAQIADLVEAAPPAQGEEIMRALEDNRELEADVFEELEPARQLDLLAERSDGEVAAMVARMEPDDAADLIEELEQQRRRRVLGLLPAAKRRRIERLLGFNPSTAGGLMNPEVVVVDGRRTVEEALAQLRESEVPPEASLFLFVHDQDGRLKGAVDVVRLVRAPAQTRVEELLGGETVAVQTDAEVPQVARLMTDYDLIMLPVVDGEGRVVGAISVDDVLELTLPADWRRRYGVARD